MSTNGLTLTLTGWVGTEPKHFTGAGTPFTSFRMASTRRYYDARQGAWVDGKTLWFTVKVWREAALNVAECLRKSDPVVVHGRLGTEEWESPEGPRSGLVLEALAIGHDLTYGRSRFARTVHRSAAGDGEDELDVLTGALDDTLVGAPADVDAAELAAVLGYDLEHPVEQELVAAPADDASDDAPDDAEHDSPRGDADGADAHPGPAASGRRLVGSGAKRR